MDRVNSQENRPIAIQISGVKKMYKLGQIGGGTLQKDLQSWWARKRGKEDPNTKIGEKRLTGDTFMALNGIDLTIYQGEAIGIIGHNGAGKSTLLKLLSQVTAPTEGRIDLYGRVASMLEVGTGFNGEMTGRENIYMNGAILGMTKAEIDAKIEDIIEFSEVRDFIDTPVKRYSSGMYVKLAFSVAAHLDSEIMIMDEVLAVGDMAFQKKCLGKMREAAKQEGRTVLYVSHNMNTIRRLCDRCVVLDKGRVVFEGEVEEAIGVYMGDAVKCSMAYNYANIEREGCLPKNEIKLLMLGLTVLEKSTNRYAVGEKIRFSIQCFANEKCDNIGVRFELFTSGVLVGTMFSDEVISASKGEMFDIMMSIDTSLFVPGVYSATILTYESNHLGEQKGLDRVENGLVFEIAYQDINGINWRHRDWGYVHFQNVSIDGIIRKEG